MGIRLIVTERGRTQKAFMENEEWTNYGTFEASLSDLCTYIVQSQEKELRRIVIREDDCSIVIDFINGVGIVASQLLIDHDAGDHDEIIRELNNMLRKEG